jgi:hypothetical protein
MHAAGVVDEYINMRRVLHDRRSEPPHVGERAEIGLEEFDRRIPATRFELCDGAGSFVRITPVNQQLRALERETIGGLFPDSVRSAGDDADFAEQRYVFPSRLRRMVLDTPQPMSEGLAA